MPAAKPAGNRFYRNFDNYSAKEFGRKQLPCYNIPQPFMKLIPSLLFLFLGNFAFSQLTEFAMYETKVYQGRAAAIKIKGNPLAERYKTIITNTYYSKNGMKEWHGATGRNFAGHYCFVYWGCGSPCKSSAVVDLKTGIVYEGISAAFNFEFRPNSRLLIVDPDTTPEGGPYKTEYWEWNDDKKKFVQLKKT